MWQDEWFDRWRNEGIPEEDWPLDELPIVRDDHPGWIVQRVWRRTACENRPGLKKFYINVRDAGGVLLGGIKIRVDVEPSNTGTAYDHPNVWQLTGWKRGREGYWEWDHYGVPTHYVLWMEDDEFPLIENVRTDLRSEYCNAGSRWDPRGWRPVNTNGVFSYDIEIQRKGEGD